MMFISDELAYDVEYAGHQVTDCSNCPYLQECKDRAEGKTKTAEHYDNGQCPLE